VAALLVQTLLPTNIFSSCGFVCVTNEQFAAIEKKWPVLKEDYLVGSPE
jgi:hypothetical protein